MTPGRFFIARAPSVRRRLEDAGWIATDRWDWDLYWRPQVPSLAAYASLRPGQRVNHFPHIGALTARRLHAEGEIASSRYVVVTGVDPLRVYAFGEGEGDDHAIVTAITRARDPMTRAVRDVLADRDACFELLRFDFDRDGAIARVVLSPEAPDAVIDDTLRLVGLVPHGDSPSVDGEERIRQIAEMELGRRGRFVRVPPSLLAEAAPLPRRSDLVLAGATPEVVPCAAHAFLADKLVLFARGRFYVPNDTAAFVWLRLEDGATPDAVAGELATQFGVPLATTRSDVWDIVARWAHDGLVRRHDRDAVPARALETKGTASIERLAEAAPRERRRLLEEIRTTTEHRAGFAGAAVAGRSKSIALVGLEAGGIGALAAVLASRGRPVASSGAVLVDERGAPLPFALSMEVSELDDVEVGALVPGFASITSWILPSELSARYVPFEPPPVAPAIGALVVVRRSKATDLRPLDKLALLAELTHLGLSATPPMDAEAAIQFVAWLSALPCHQLDLGPELSDAADRIEEWLG